ncbi:prenyltransferase [Paludibacterium paludis]|uniref:1,4-dihydroxy-2-naphthoate octaprenyltransferase n=1 Tax=Paludibacterium paludis TaxID=1225769 RepID=A0A918P090_9NEIS|nr:prenyltransferase [Paludibacterium paludis]GGY09469.1 hypothetical protein GCM10011289_10310 [Paludibacterium paludis]
MSSSPSLSAERDYARLARHPLRFWLATRPAFLSLTFCALWPGLAAAHRSLLPALPMLLAGCMLALLTHAAVNVINDVADEDNGCDAMNRDRVFPFTGGSRFIQNGVLSRDGMKRLALLLFCLVAAGGLALVAVAGAPLLYIGLTGVGLGWAYSAEPLKLNSRGLGEVSVAVCFWLIPLGMVALAGGVLSPAVLASGISVGCLASALLYINQFPDRAADRAAGKWHWVARLPTRSARWGYPLLTGAGYGWLAIATEAGILPVAALTGMVTLPLTMVAAYRLWRDHDRPARLAPAIILTIAAANLHPLALAAGLWFG